MLASAATATLLPVRTRCEGACRLKQRRGRCVVHASSDGLPPSGGRVVSVNEARELIFGPERVLVIDVRSVREHKNETIFLSRNASLYDIPPTWPLGAIDVVLSSGNDELMPRFSKAFETQVAAALGSAGKAGRALLVCSNGKRSALAAELLAEEDYSNLSFVDGGMNAWLDAYSPRGVPRRRVQGGVYKDTGNIIWTDSAEEQEVLPAAKDMPV